MIGRLLSMLRGARHPGRPPPSEAERLYGVLVAAARTPALYGAQGVADTPVGRFEMLAALVALATLRLTTPDDLPGRMAAQALFDVFFLDMEQNLNRLGVGDMSLGKKNKALMKAFNGRLAGLEAALAPDADPAQFQALVGRTSLGGRDDAVAAGRLAAHFRAVAAQFDRLGRQPLLEGRLALTDLPAPPDPAP